MGDLHRFNADIRRTVAALHDSNAQIGRAVQAMALHSRVAWTGGLVLGAALVLGWRWRRPRPHPQDPPRDEPPPQPVLPAWRPLLLALLPLFLQHLVLPRLPARWQAWMGHPLASVVLKRWLRR